MKKGWNILMGSLLVLLLLSLCGLILAHGKMLRDAEAVIAARPEPEEPTKGELFRTFLETAHFGIDLSEFNTVTDWNAVKESGVEFVIIRLGGRGYGTGALYADEYARKYLKGATEAGLKIGGYFFSAAVTEEEAKMEAILAKTIVGAYELDLPIFFDTENTSQGGRANSLTPEERTAVALSFCREIEKEGIFTGGVYSYYEYLLSQLELEKLSDYPVWLAHFVPESYGPFPRFPMTAFPGSYAVWQFTNSAQIDGIKGRVDADLIQPYWEHSPYAEEDPYAEQE